jgi:hypothetical protein
MSERKLIQAACLAGALVASCTPYPETQKRPIPPQGPQAQQGTVTGDEQQKLKEERQRAAEEAERQQAEAGQTMGGGNATTGTTPAGGTGTTPAGGETKPKRDYDFATPVPGKAGFVLSPYNGKVIDVRDIPSGTLVQDPTYPASEKKYFRVP